MAAFVYEGVLLFGVAFLAGYLWSSLTQQRNALHGRQGLQAFMFLVLGVYFTWFWTHGGQTLAMKTWGIRLVTTGGQAVTRTRAVMRYLCSWVWLLPPLAASPLIHAGGGPRLWVILLGWMAVYALSSKLRSDGQFWHDRLCGTRLTRHEHASR